MDKVRIGVIGSGAIACIAGLSPYKSRRTLYQEWIGEIEPKEVDNYHTDRGIFKESGLVKWVGKRVGIDFEQQSEGDKAAHMVWCVHPEHNWAIASPDGMACERVEKLVLCEIKCPSPYSAMHQWGEDGSGADGVPEAVLVQVQWQMGVSGATATYVGADIGDIVHVYKVDYDGELFDALLKEAGRFLRCVHEKRLPAIDGGDQGAKWLKQNHTKDNGVEIDSATNPTLEVLIEDQYLPTRAARVALEKEELGLKNEIQAIMGNAPRVVGRWGKLTWEKTKPKKLRTNWEAIARCLAERGGIELDALVKEHSVLPSGSRQFRAYPKKGNK